MADTRRLPPAITESYDWQMGGLCRGRDSALFFHPDGERGYARAAREERAKQLCQRCPVLEACRTHALAAEEPYGIWAGMTEGELKQAKAAKRRRCD